MHCPEAIEFRESIQGICYFVFASLCNIHPDIYCKGDKMITPEERKEIIVKGQADGAKLFGVAEALYNILYALTWVVGIAGGGMFVMSIPQGNLAVSIGIVVVTAIVCTASYASAVLCANTIKVLVHILFSNLALLSEEKK